MLLHYLFWPAKSMCKVACDLECICKYASLGQQKSFLTSSFLEISDLVKRAFSTCGLKNSFVQWRSECVHA